MDKLILNVFFLTTTEHISSFRLLPRCKCKKSQKEVGQEESKKEREEFL